MAPLRSLVLTSLLVAMAGAAVGAQQPTSPAAPALPIPEVGDMAPDFAIKGATRYGLLRDASKVSDYRGSTVVIWFFFKARTRG